jgi:hypothetical protein
LFGAKNGGAIGLKLNTAQSDVDVINRW